MRRSLVIAFLPVVGFAACATGLRHAIVRRDRIEGAGCRTGQVREFFRNLASSRTAAAGCRSVDAHVTASSRLIERSAWNE